MCSIIHFSFLFFFLSFFILAQSAWAVKYTDYILPEG